MELPSLSGNHIENWWQVKRTRQVSSIHMARTSNIEGKTPNLLNIEYLCVRFRNISIWINQSIGGAAARHARFQSHTHPKQITNHLRMMKQSIKRDLKNGRKTHLIFNWPNWFRTEKLMKNKKKQFDGCPSPPIDCADMGNRIPAQMRGSHFCCCCEAKLIYFLCFRRNRNDYVRNCDRVLLCLRRPSPQLLRSMER